jgi:RNA polymerase-binding transcription factor DksA
MIIDQLEPQLNEVREALERIDKGTFGICTVGGEAIEKERLEAIPSARTCKAHMND